MDMPTSTKVHNTDTDARESYPLSLMRLSVYPYQKASMLIGTYSVQVSENNHTSDSPSTKYYAG